MLYYSIIRLLVSFRPNTMHVLENYGMGTSLVNISHDNVAISITYLLANGRQRPNVVLITGGCRESDDVSKGSCQERCSNIYSGRARGSLIYHGINCGVVIREWPRSIALWDRAYWEEGVGSFPPIKELIGVTVHRAEGSGLQNVPVLKMTKSINKCILQLFFATTHEIPPWTVKRRE